MAMYQGEPNVKILFKVPCRLNVLYLLPLEKSLGLKNLGLVKFGCSKQRTKHKKSSYDKSFLG